MRHPAMKSVVSKRALQGLFASASGLGLLLGASTVVAQSTIREPGNHPAYVAEVEPHFSLGLFPPPGPADGFGYGFGLRATIPLLHNGFVPTINNSVGISFGFDWLHYSGNDVSFGPCARREPAPGDPRIHVCTAVGDPYGGPANYLFFPAAMQWNFWLSDKFSTFAEPGLALYYAKGAYEDARVGATPVFEIGGRWHFMRLVQLTVRFGYPTTSLGVSFMF